MTTFCSLSFTKIMNNFMLAYIRVKMFSKCTKSRSFGYTPASIRQPVVWFCIYTCDVYLCTMRSYSTATTQTKDNTSSRNVQILRVARSHRWFILKFWLSSSFKATFHDQLRLSLWSNQLVARFIVKDSKVSVLCIKVVNKQISHQKTPNR